MRKISIFMLVLFIFSACSFFEKEVEPEIIPEGAEVNHVTDISFEIVEEDTSVLDIAEEDNEVVLRLDEGMDIELIREYYRNLENGELEEAYAMKFEPSDSYETFLAWYEYTATAVPRDFVELGDHKYEFYVDLAEINKKLGEYKVKMEVKDGLLDTISSVKVSDNYSFTPSISHVGDKVELYVNDNLMAVIDESKNLPTEISWYVDDSAKVIGNNKYLSYSLGHYESRTIHLVEIATGEEVLMVYGDKENGFSNNNQFYYNCLPSGMAGGGLEIYDGKTFEKFKGINEAKITVSCDGFDSSENRYAFKIGVNGFDETEDWAYYFETDSLEKL